MKVQGKRALSWLLALAMCLSMVPGVALGASDDVYTLVSDASTLKADDEIIIVALNSSVAMAAYNNGNNCPQVEIEKSEDGKSITAPAGLQFITLVDGSEEGFALKIADDTYLAATGGTSKNYLKSQDIIDAKSSFSITIDEATGEANIVAKDGDTTRNTLRYNSGNSIFSCYATGTQNPVAVYKKAAGNTGEQGETVAKPVATPAAGAVKAGTSVTLSCQTEGATIYYTLDGTEPTRSSTEYTSAIVISEAVTIKAIATDPTGELEDSAVLTAAYTINDAETLEYISQVKSKTGAKVEVTGVALHDYSSAGANLGVYIQDDTGSVLLYKLDGMSEIKEGDQVTAYGTVALYSNKWELTNGAVESIQAGTAVTPAPITLEEYKALTKDSDAVGTLVSLSGITVKSHSVNSYNTDTVKLTDGENELTSTLDNRRAGFVAGSLDHLEEGNKVLVTGIAEVGGLQLRTANDIAISIAGDVAKLTTTLGEGDKVAIYNPSNKKVLTATATGKTLKGEDAEPENGELTLTDTLAFMTVKVNDQDQLTFVSADGKYLTSGATGSSLTFANAESDYSLWELEEQADGVYIHNVNAAYNDTKNQYLEYYNAFTTYSIKSGGAAYLMELYAQKAMETVATPVITPAESSSATATLEVTITCATDGASIYYTVDGTEPTASSATTTSSSTAYTAPFTLDLSDGNKTVKAIAVKEEMKDSKVATKMYSYADPDKDFVQVVDKAELLEGGFFVIVPKEFPGWAFSTSFAYKPTAVAITLEKGSYAPTILVAPQGTGVSLQYYATGKYVGYDSSSSTSIQAVDAAYTFNVEGPNADGAFRLIFSTATTRALTLQGVNGNVFGAYAVSNDGKTSSSSDGSITYGPYESDMLIYRSVKGYLYNPTVSLGVINAAIVGQDWKTTYSFAETDVVSNVVAQFSADGTTWTAAEVDTDAMSITIPGSAITAGTDTLTLKITATDTRDGKESTMTASAEITVKDEPVISAVEPANGAETGADKTPTVKVTVVNGGTFTAKITIAKGVETVVDAADMTVNGATAVYTPEADLADGWHDVTVTVTREDGKEVSKTWGFTAGTSNNKNYFGQLHSHTAEYSDGAGTLAQAMEYVKNTAYRNNVSFVAFTDHSNYFDTSSAANPEAAIYDVTKMTAESKEKWDAYREAAAQFNADPDNDQVAIAGFEMTWSGGPGHINTFNSPGLVSRNNKTLNNKTNDAGMQAYYAALSNDAMSESISQFNHPGTTFGTFSEFAYYDETIDSRITLVEVGNGEGAIRSGGYFPSYSEYIKALDKGWHLAPTNNQDNHAGHWGDSNDGRTVIYTGELNESTIYQAMRDMRIYSTEDKNLDIVYKVNGLMLGTIVDEVPAQAVFTATISDPDNEGLGTVEIVTNGGAVVASFAVGSASSYDLEYTLDAPKAGYYFLRVTEEDKDIAVTAPVWLGKAKAVGMSELTTSAYVVMKGEAASFSNEFFNNESVPATLKSVKYEIDDVVYLEEDVNVNIAPLGTLERKLDVTFDKDGKQTLKLTAVVSVGGEVRTLTSALTVAVKDPEKMVYVGVDGSHHNEYVTGNYKDSMGNFATLASDYSIRVNVLYTHDELMSALTNPKYKMMVFTTPTRRLTTAAMGQDSYDVYTEEELAAIKAFSETGGMVVVTGWGDYYESYDYCPKEPGMQMSAQQNALLAAIGSSIRVSDDEAKDNVNKPGSNASRLYLTDYNGFKSPLLAGVDPAQVWSQYGGSTIYAVDANGAPAETLPESVTPMVSGYGRYESDGSGIVLNKIDSSDDDGDGHYNGAADTSVMPPKYVSDPPVYDAELYSGGVVDIPEKTCLLTASETVTHADGTTSLVVVSGGAFMSNFEVKFDLDNATQLGYSNPVVLGNLLELVNSPEITAIADVHDAEEGEEFTVEGIATSNASGYDRKTAFFDCIYLQDDTAGINVFQVTGDIQRGQKLRITGYVGSYNGEKQLVAEKVKVLDTAIQMPEPKKVTTEEIANMTYLGTYVQVDAVVVEILEAEGVPSSIMVRDDSGVTARIFIDGYITATSDPDKTDIPNLEVGHTITAKGMSSHGQVTGGGMDARVRISDRDDIVCGTETVEIPSEKVPVYGPSTGSGAATTPDITIGNVSEEEDGTVTVDVPAVGSEFTPGAEEKVIDLNEENDVYIEGGGLNILIPAGTLTEGDDLNAMLVDPEQPGNAIQVTLPDGSTMILPFALVGGGEAAYLANVVGSYELVNNTVDYADVPDEYWAGDAIDLVSANELFQGADGLFQPETVMTRGMLVTVLSRLAGEKESSAASSFADVPADSWYSSAVAWAQANDIVRGDGVNFDPDRGVTRQELCLILVRFVNYMGLSLNEKGSTEGFADKETVDAWASAEVDAILEAGLITGKPGGYIDPTSGASRGEIAVVLVRLLQNVLGK